MELEQPVCAGNHRAWVSRLVNRKDNMQAVNKYRLSAAFLAASFIFCLEQMPAPSVVVVQDTSGRPGPRRVLRRGDGDDLPALGAVGDVTDGTVRDVRRGARFSGSPTSPPACASRTPTSSSRRSAGAIELDGETVNHRRPAARGRQRHRGRATRGAEWPARGAVDYIRTHEGELLELARSEGFTVGRRNGADGLSLRDPRGPGPHPGPRRCTRGRKALSRWSSPTPRPRRARRRSSAAAAPRRWRGSRRWTPGRRRSRPSPCR